MHKLILSALFLSFLSLGAARAEVDLSKPLDLKFTAVDGRKVDLADMRGKVVLIDFWATWCPPCNAISPDLVELYKKYHSKGLEIIGVSVDSDKQGLLDFVKKEGEAWPQYFDGQGADNVLAGRFGIEQFPTLWLIDKQGKVATTNFFKQWLTDGALRPKTSEGIKQKIGAALEKQLQAP
jgi:thiol-disulfide isomerase/thioredoxin